MNLIDTFRAAYHSYLLRLWRDGAHSAWRASLQCTATTSAERAQVTFRLGLPNTPHGAIV